ncbi:hypothetical protein AAFF_G00259950 [Aldrovandia affinis]|uniref:Uncharacterized protein n=1 Tax=Aldrovandia affinis TaxID=143900 RepID=A0AAD7RC22_9TELE|nr:hypothetical protein AAFF_G00259950 [Aldrovandia affinis]
MRASRRELIEQLLQVLRPLVKVTTVMLESDGLAESTPIVACMSDPWFTHLQFLQEETSVEASSHLAQQV